MVSLYHVAMHERFMTRCLALAEQGRGKTGINPMVGAVLVREGNIIAEGYHDGYGKAHAERQLLEKFEQKIDTNDVLYVNLEPCCHTRKKTPPCAQCLVQRGVKHVVLGMIDPNPAVAGKGVAYLREQGVHTEIAWSMTAECHRLNRGFVSLMTRGRPWITLKSACAMDGWHCKDDGSHLKITDAVQDEWSHRHLRAKHDAILVGVGTILMDDPRLTTRYIDNPPPLFRVVLDAKLRTPPRAKVACPGTIIIVGPEVSATDKNTFESAGVRVLTVPTTSEGFVWDDVWKSLSTPRDDFHGIASVLLEGGKKTWQMFRDARMVDEEVALVGIPAS
jgi:diaminohydroxyphosphoribosylaminopyrimidine deaminase/5-amino-6-(5-phosphoribosylamino)uracil reductase